MLTPWGEELDRANPLPEYPRPQMRRAQWQSLNGPWEYAFTQGEDAPARYEGTITVPFSPESALSGVGRRLEPGQTLWYRRRFMAPADAAGGHVQQHMADVADGHVLLHFGAVDQSARVFIGGVEVCRHSGGYLPFTADITGALKNGENEIAVCVQDESDTSYHSRGKQTLSPGGIWYTAQSGIWQSVWLERVPKNYIERLTITPRCDRDALELTVHSEATLPCTASYMGRTETFLTNQKTLLPLPDYALWTPENPTLYDLNVLMEGDCVESYFAMRSFGVEKDEGGVPRLTLNGRPYFHTGVLDQGYWPDGLYTAPSDEAMIADIRLMKNMGFNMLRKHIKIEPLRWYYHCDRLGMLVWQDMVNGGTSYKKLHITAPLVLGNSHRDSDYAYFSRADAPGREEYLQELDETVRHLYNCPCIAMWVPFNEGWGQFDAVQAAKRIRALDDTRLIDHASGWHDQGAGDVKSLHVYFRPYRFKADKRGRAVALTEFGGYAYREEGHCWSERLFGYKTLASREALLAEFDKLYSEQIIPAKAKGLAASVYTQLSDVEEEVNGFVSYDRRAVKLQAEDVARINARLRD